MVNNTKVLLMPDQINGPDSGSQSARATLKYLTELGYSVAIYATKVTQDPHPDLQKAAALFDIPTDLRCYEHLLSPVLTRHFVEILKEFQPDYLFFAGSIQKPAVLAREARRRGIRTVYLFYINDFFCPLVYAGLESGPCTKCIRKPHFAAVRNGCVTRKGLREFIKRWFIIHSLGKEIRRSFRVLGYSNDQLNIYHQFGVSDERLARVGFQFTPDDLIGRNVRDEGYFVITGQPIIQKGFHLLADIFSNLKTSPRIKMSFRSPEQAASVMHRFNLTPCLESGLVEIVTGLEERSKYLDFLAGARGVILPSYYPTTGEFVLQESMFLGKPVHVFNVGAHKNVLKDGQDALVSEVGDLLDFAQKIDHINSDANFRKTISAGARRTAEQFYSHDQQVLLGNALPAIR